MLGNHQSAITNEMLTVVNQQFALCIFIGDRRLVITQYLFPSSRRRYVQIAPGFESGEGKRARRAKQCRPTRRRVLPNSKERADAEKADSPPFQSVAKLSKESDKVNRERDEVCGIKRTPRADGFLLSVGLEQEGSPRDSQA